MMSEDRQLFLELGVANKQISSFVFALLEDLPLSAEDQYSFGTRLVELGEAIQRRSSQRPYEVVETDIPDLLLHTSLPPAS
jgi:hypothetical protein